MPMSALREVVGVGQAMDSIENVHIIHETGSTVPTFLLKLVNLLADESNHEYVDWSESGTSFIVKDQVQFSKIVLPKYFKHNKFASFVRQLNMYGFRKITSITQSGLKFEREEVEFYHCMFIRGQELLLEHIKRKVNKAEEGSRHHSEDVNKVLAEVKQMKGNQETIEARLSEMKQENEDLWREVVNLRQKHSHQQKVVNKLIQFLVNLVQQHGSGVKRKIPLMIGDGSSGATNYVPPQKYSKIMFDTEDQSPPKPGSPIGPTVSFPESVHQTYVENEPGPNMGSDGPSIIEVIQDVPAKSVKPPPAGNTATDTLPLPQINAATVLHSPSDPEFDMSEYINPSSLPSGTEESGSEDFPDVLSSLIENPYTGIQLTDDANNNQRNNGNCQNTLAQYTPNPLSPRLCPGSLKNHIDGVHQSLSNLFNNNQVQLDYDLIQELFSSSPDIMPPSAEAGQQGEDPDKIVGNELVVHPGSSGSQ